MINQPVPVKGGGVATAEQGTVMLDGPNGLAVTMTPDSAEATAASLVAAAREARRQTPPPG
ncbi:hypothetical protein SAMN06297144_2890 [Sphingomonas guangdongensis]|uniref:Uncharacterized protein n=1 Tax=Sphingomonas guangdongensis TaxID=1141890 RepID=A0A285R1M8_9SPHN|nr:hypothetical protein [Sphingomonas guangdongensis]SOB87754.1 hypothetical protein SAMN06297144_2890 [Sphingomonas guangdongensis]